MNTSNSQILIVEDEPKIASLLSDYLQQDGFETHHIERGDRVIDWLQSNQPDLILLDLMLPGMSGIDICKKVRVDSTVPIIMITAKVEEIDRLLGLELGADDYICKPFSPREVVARVKAVLRRAQFSTHKPTSDELQMDSGTFSASFGGQALNLTPVEFSLLQTLSEQPGRVFSRDQLMNEMYSDYRVVSDRAVDTHVKNLRRKLAQAAPGIDLVESVYGLGYRYNRA